jgi:hypothetical protein
MMAIPDFQTLIFSVLRTSAALVGQHYVVQLEALAPVGDMSDDNINKLERVFHA